MRRAAFVLWLLSVAATALAQDAGPLSVRWGVDADAWTRRPLPRPLCFGTSRAERAFAGGGYHAEGETGARRGYVDVIGLGLRAPVREAIPGVGTRAISGTALDARLEAPGVEGASGPRAPRPRAGGAARSSAESARQASSL